MVGSDHNDINISVGSLNNSAANGISQICLEK
jgi:hypothetical protein